MMRTWAATLVAGLLCTAAIAAAPPDTRVADAAQKGDTASVRALVKQRADVASRQGDGATALHWASHWDDVAMADALIRAGAPVNAANDFGVTPLWLACVNGSAPMAERLLKAGADPSTTLPSGESALMTASRSGNPDVVKLLLAHGAKVNAKESTKGQTALMWAVAEQHPKVVAALIEGGADVSARSNVRPRRVNTDVGGFNAGSTVDVEQGGYTPLLFAAQQGDIESAKLLLAAGAGVNDAAPDGTTPLVVASHSGHDAVAALLVEKGADVNSDGAGYTALHAAILRDEEGLVKQLLARGANPNAPLVKPTPVRRSSADYALEFGYVSASPMWLAARFAQPAVMRLLASNGGDGHAALKDGTTVLMAAVQGTRRVEPGFTRDAVEDERLVLDAARVAVELGADINAANKDGNTALHTAAQKKLNSVVQFLADRGADVNAKNKKGQTPLALAGGGGGRGGGGGGGGGTGSPGATAELLRKLGAKETPKEPQPAPEK